MQLSQLLYSSIESLKGTVTKSNNPIHPGRII